jgi:hypothetical protein
MFAPEPVVSMDP